MIKCIGCLKLLREEIDFDDKHLVVYTCPRFSYACAVSGLLRPGKNLLEAAENCPEDPLSHCAVCSSTEISHYGKDIIAICKEHDRAWSRWLEEHPERRAYLSPRGRLKMANWIEVFREFIEDMRPPGRRTDVKAGF